MAKVLNISEGPRGAYLGGVLVMVEPGQTAEADDYCEEWFEVVKEARAAKAKEPAETPQVD